MGGANAPVGRCHRRVLRRRRRERPATDRSGRAIRRFRAAGTSGRAASVARSRLAPGDRKRRLRHARGGPDHQLREAPRKTSAAEEHSAHRAAQSAAAARTLPEFAGRAAIPASRTRSFRPSTIRTRYRRPFRRRRPSRSSRRCRSSRSPRPDNDPFAPVGIGIGTLRLRPFVESGIGFDSNPNRVVAPRKGSAYWRGDAGLAVQSDWSQHSITDRCAWAIRISSPSPPRTGRTAPARSRAASTSRATRRSMSAAPSRSTRCARGRPNSSASNDSISTNRPLVWTIGGYAGVTQRFNRLSVSLRGVLDRSQYGDATYSDGSTVLSVGEQLHDRRHPAAHVLRAHARPAAVRRGDGRQARLRQHATT